MAVESDKYTAFAKGPAEQQDHDDDDMMITMDDLGLTVTVIMVDDVRLRIDTRPYILLDSK
jgi:hypothetical protein